MTPAARRSIAWAGLVAVIYLTHAAIGLHERHRMDDMMMGRSWWPLSGDELLVCHAAAVLGFIVLVVGAVPPLRPKLFETALIATALPAVALLPLLVGPLRLGFRLSGHAEPRDIELMSGIIVLDVLIALAAVGVVVVEMVTAHRRRSLQD